MAVKRTGASDTLVPTRDPIAMHDRLRDLIARDVFHPLQGMTLGDWWALLRRHRFAVDLEQLPHALVPSAVSAANSVNKRVERLRFGKRIDTDDGIISVYTAMYDAYFGERHLIPEGRLCEVDEPLRRRIAGEWNPSFDEWGSIR